MRRDLELDFEPSQLVLDPPDRSQLKEFFRRFEFRGLLSRLDTLDQALPAAAPVLVDATPIRWRDGSFERRTERVGLAASGRSHRSGDRRRSCSQPAPRSRSALSADRLDRLPRCEAGGRRRDRRHADRGLPDRPGPFRVRALRPRRGVRDRARAGPRRGGGDRRARRRRRAAAADRAADARTPGGAEPDGALPRDRAPPHAGARRHGARRGEDRHLSDGRDHGSPGRAGRRARVDGLRARGRGVHARLHPAGRPRPVRAARPESGPQGQDRLLDRREGAALDPPGARDRPGDRGVARALEAAQHLSRPAAGPDRRVDGTLAHDDQPDGRRHGPALDDEPEPAVDPDPHRSRARDPLRVHRRGRGEAALRRLLADRAAHPRPSLRRAEAPRGLRARRGHPPRDRRRGARQGPGDAHERRALDREDDQLRDRLRDLGLRPLREPRDPARGGAGAASTPTWRASRSSRTSSREPSSRRRATATRRRSSAGAARSPS